MIVPSGCFDCLGGDCINSIYYVLWISTQGNTSMDISNSSNRVYTCSFSFLGSFPSGLGLSIGNSSFCHSFSALVIEVVLGCAWKLGMNRAKTPFVPTLPRDQWKHSISYLRSKLSWR